MIWEKLERGAGVLLPIFSLPGRNGIGNVGREAFHFIDLLANCGIKYWQVCPVGPTGYGSSPYQALSSFAGNPHFLDLGDLVARGWLREDEMCPTCPNLEKDKVHYDILNERLYPALKLAYSRFKKSADIKIFKEFDLFKKKSASWLTPYANFRALKDKFNDKPWWEWPKSFRKFSELKKSSLLSLEGDAERWKFYTFLFEVQWNKLKLYAEKKDIKLIGDIPIYVSLDSADVWANPELFELNEDGTPFEVAGVPPDYFARKGQRWGNPLYDWKLHEKSNFSWWLERIKKNLQLFHAIRLDHYRGFYDYWAVPFEESTAEKGRWRRAPGEKLLKAVNAKFPKAIFIAENLGELSDGAKKFCTKMKIPSMSVLQFGFYGDNKNPHLPHNCKADTILYTGTHDNNTSLGWYNEANEETKDFCRRYLRVDGQSIPWDLIRCAYQSVCDTIIIPLQDLLNLDSSARTNTPGTIADNWIWRCTAEDLNQLQQSSQYLKELAQLYGR